MKKAIVLLTTLIAVMTISCNENGGSAQRENPLLAEWTTPLGVPPFDQIQLDDYMPAFEAAMKAHKEEVEAIVNNPEEPTWENTILALDNAGELLSRVSNCFFLVAEADTNEQMQQIQVKVSPMLSAHSDEIMMNP
ncbi:MAG: peptidase M3, partial [Tidjanibacter sp.]|nr:peptidase M3 [Tidjanibacter sp.]